MYGTINSSFNLVLLFQAKQIALNAQFYAREHLQAEDVLCYYVFLFNVSLTSHTVAAMFASSKLNVILLLGILEEAQVAGGSA